MATFSNEGGTGVITITIGDTPQSFGVFGVRVDASALDIKDQIIATDTSTTDATSVPLGGGTDEGGVSGGVGEVAAGLIVTANKDADLACSAAAPTPSIAVAEGFTAAWGEFSRPNRPGLASVRIVPDNLPDGAKVEWPGSVASTINVAAWGEDENLQATGTLTLDAAESSNNGKVVVYDYTRALTYPRASCIPDDPDTDTDESVRHFPFRSLASAPHSFTIVPSKTTFMGNASTF